MLDSIYHMTVDYFMAREVERTSNQVLCNVWSYHFYCMTLSTEY